MRTESNYIGRFAPSPSGPLHFGSLVAAVGSYLQARSQNGQWLVRIEDLDPPREVKGASTLILRQLEAFGLHWDGAVMYQSQRHHAYDQHLEFLHEKGVLFACDCSRKNLLAQPFYDGSCVTKNLPIQSGLAWRIRATNTALPFVDGVFGACRFETAENDAFIVRRRDGFYAYQLAVVVDDIAQGITEVVRGADLLDTTPRQLLLWRLFGQAPPSFIHLPLVLGNNGQKLSKQNHAPALDLSSCSTQLVSALKVLGQQPPAQLHGAAPPELLDWAVSHWQLAQVPKPQPPFPG